MAVNVRKSANVKIMQHVILLMDLATAQEAILGRIVRRSVLQDDTDRAARRSVCVSMVNVIIFPGSVNVIQDGEDLCKICRKYFTTCFDSFCFNDYRCEDLCPMGKHGDDCKSDCRCQNGGTCDPETGDCYCRAGWTGSVCANRCPFGFWGLNCREPCDCFNGASCHHVTGDCECQPGFRGDRVSSKILNLCWKFNQY